MQMAKTSAALQKLSEERVPYISVICDPTTGGTSASFVMLGDINIAEPGALSFAGPVLLNKQYVKNYQKDSSDLSFYSKRGC